MCPDLSRRHKGGGVPAGAQSPDADALRGEAVHTTGPDDQVVQVPVGAAAAREERERRGRRAARAVRVGEHRLGVGLTGAEQPGTPAISRPPPRTLGSPGHPVRSLSHSLGSHHFRECDLHIVQSSDRIKLLARTHTPIGRALCDA